MPHLPTNVLISISIARGFNVFSQSLHRLFALRNYSLFGTSIFNFSVTLRSVVHKILISNTVSFVIISSSNISLSKNRIPNSRFRIPCFKGSPNLACVENSICAFFLQAC